MECSAASSNPSARSAAATTFCKYAWRESMTLYTSLAWPNSGAFATPSSAAVVHTVCPSS